VLPEKKILTGGTRNWRPLKERLVALYLKLRKKKREGEGRGGGLNARRMQAGARRFLPQRVS